MSAPLQHRIHHEDIFSQEPKPGSVQGAADAA